MTFEEAVAGFPAWATNLRAPNVDYSPWHLVEHLRLTQLDMLHYIEDPLGYLSAPWPSGYWPARDATTDEAGFAASVAAFGIDLAALERIALDEQRDLFAVFQGTEDHTPLRGLMIIGNHNSYHVGELGSMRGVMAGWPPDHR